MKILQENNSMTAEDFAKKYVELQEAGRTIGEGSYEGEDTDAVIDKFKSVNRILDKVYDTADESQRSKLDEEDCLQAYWECASEDAQSKLSEIMLNKIESRKVYNMHILRENNMDSMYYDSDMRLSYIEESLPSVRAYLESNPDSRELNIALRKLYDAFGFVEDAMIVNNNDNYTGRGGDGYGDPNSYTD